jgi:hypothetical protein
MAKRRKGEKVDQPRRWPAQDVATFGSQRLHNAETLEAMRKAGAEPEHIYAYKKTGIPGPDDMDAWPALHRKLWKEAVAEYLKAQKANKGKTRPDPRRWSTEIPELEACPITAEDFDQVVECLTAIGPIQNRSMTVGARTELAAVLLADACANAYRSAEAQGEADKAPLRYSVFESLVLRRAREIYAQGRI